VVSGDVVVSWDPARGHTESKIAIPYRNMCLIFGAESSFVVQKGFLVQSR